MLRSMKYDLASHALVGGKMRIALFIQLLWMDNVVEVVSVVDQNIEENSYLIGREYLEENPYIIGRGDLEKNPYILFSSYLLAISFSN